MRILTQCSHIHPGRITTAIYLGSGRKTLRDGLLNSDVILTTYETMRRDWEEGGPLFKVQWYRVVLDEGMYKQDCTADELSMEILVTLK